MNSIYAWTGDTIPLTSTAPDDTAESATLIIGTVGEEAVYTQTANFVDDVADLTITDEENVIPVGEYKYMIEVTYSDGSQLTFPKPDDCEPENLPDFIIKDRILDISGS